ncbi:MAG: hypothetical protein AAFN10_18145 [Bacteroidota bacterium]
MKNLLIYFSLLILGLASAFAQAPQAISYQAVARDANGECISDASISLRFSIRDASDNGPIMYQEQHIGVATNAQGLFSLVIGADPALATGAGQVSDFAELSWDNQPKWLEIDMDPSGGATFVLVGNQQLISVPYALSAGNGLQYSATNQDQFMRWYGANDSINGLIGGTGTGLNNGVLALYNSLGEERAGLRSQLNGIDEYGSFVLYGANGTLNHAMSVISSNGRSRGAQSWRDDLGAAQVEVYINNNNQGVIEADVKNFVMDHPLDPNKEIVYACIEGPEAAAYERGTIQLVNGEAEVNFSESFSLLANPSTMTFVLTPRSASSMGLAAIEATATGFKIKELQQGNGSYEVDWEVKAVRNGFEDYQVIREKRVDEFADIKQK